MTIEQEVADLTTATTDLLDAVNIKRQVLDDAADTAVAAKDTAVAAKDTAVAAKDIAVGAVSGSVNTFFAATKSAGDALAAGLGDGATVIVDRDETRVGITSRYTVSSGSLVFVDDQSTFRTDKATVGNAARNAGAPKARDAVVVARDVEGSTDCHGFADDTVMKNITDYGGYGVFDNTVKVEGSHTHNHVFAFQDRTDYAGSGVLQNMAGLYSKPKMTGSGVVDSRLGAVINDVTKTGSGSITAQIGVSIRNLTAAASNVGLDIGQVSGYSIYAMAGAPMAHLGAIGVGTIAGAGTKLHVSGGSGAGDVAILVTKTNGWSFYSGDNTAKMYNAGEVKIGARGGTPSLPLTVTGASTGPVLYFTTTATSSYLGNASADGAITFVNNSVARVILDSDADGSAFRPYTTNTNDLGTSDKRWKTVNASQVRTHATTVAGLPSATGIAGTRAFVTDATASTFASTVAGGGSIAVPVYSDGSVWKVG